MDPHAAPPDPPASSSGSSSGGTFATAPGAPRRQGTDTSLASALDGRVHADQSGAGSTPVGAHGDGPGGRDQSQATSARRSSLSSTHLDDNDEYSAFLDSDIVGAAGVSAVSGAAWSAVETHSRVSRSGSVPAGRSGSGGGAGGDGGDESSHTDGFADLPPRILFDVFERLAPNVADLIAVAGTCRGWRRVASVDALWRPVAVGILPPGSPLRFTVRRDHFAVLFPFSVTHSFTPHPFLFWQPPAD